MSDRTEMNRETMLARLRVVSANLNQARFEVDEVGTMLACRHISPEGALYWLQEADLLELCLTRDERRAGAVAE